MAVTLAAKHANHASRDDSKALLPLALGALGVVFGDIGTSPLYALREALSGTHGLAPSEHNVLALLSMVTWAIMLVVMLKYVWIMMRLDNKGEGGTLALLALAQRLYRENPRRAWLVAAGGVFAASLFYGDAMITPAISVLSAVEGLSVLAPHLHEWVVPLTLGIIIGLFTLQRFGTGHMGRLFGPVTLGWFVTIGLLGVLSVAQNPGVLAALNPAYALSFAFAEPGKTFFVLGAVFLAITGAEALYADMGHFGAKPIRLAWLAVVFPALLANYYGQGALVLRDPAAIKNPFYLLAPDWLLAPLIVLATAATVIASQAVISGAYSMTLQAARLGFLPRVGVRHTSDVERGQIYIPFINWLLLACVVLIIVGFRSSDALASAYGIAVSGTLMIDSLLAIAVLVAACGRGASLKIGLLALFFVLEVIFFSANSIKILAGGWLPLLVGLVLFAVLTTWRRGTQIISARQKNEEIDRKTFLDGMFEGVTRVPGTAIFLTANLNSVPSALLHNLKHNKVIHERVIFLTVETADTPYADEAERLSIDDLGNDFHSVVVRYGFREEPDVPRALALGKRRGFDIEPMETSYFLARPTVSVATRGGWFAWRRYLFAWMQRNASNAAEYFKIPPNRVVEMGSRLVL